MATASFYARSVGVLSLLWGMVFAFLGAILYFLVRNDQTALFGFVLSPFAFAAIIALLFVFLQFLISPFLMDLQLSWIYDMSWISPQELPEEMYQALMKQFQKHNFSTSKIGIIHDGAPNAFTYGHFKKNARIVITEGIIDLLEPEERVAVLTHEVGHIVHLDFVFMTIAQAVPLFFYFIYISSRSFAEAMSRANTGNDSNKGKITPAIYAVAVISYIVYFVSGYVVLLLSRYRENYADAFSAIETENPNAMSTALVKVAYGLVVADSEKQSKMKSDEISPDERRQVRRRSGFNNAMRTMGLADVNTAKGLVMQAYGKSEEINAYSVAAAAAWDLQTPWAKFLELNSTHPLTGKRLKHLDDIAEDMGAKRKYPQLGEVQIPESLLDEFITDLTVQYVFPIGLIIIPLVAGLIGQVSGITFLGGVGIGLLIASTMWLYRVSIKYPGIDNYDDPQRTKNTVLEALSSMERDGYYEASPVRGKPILLEGTVMGKGTPGFYLSEDFVLRDETGFVVIDFSSIIPFYNWWYAYRHVNAMMDQKVRVIGWYHRSIMPRVQLYKVYREDDKIHKNRWRGANRIFALILAVVGLYLLLMGFGLI